MKLMEADPLTAASMSASVAAMLYSSKSTDIVQDGATQHGQGYVMPALKQ